ncbi:MAG TPA: hypothetical protein VIH21_03665 [Dehalococcoidia bacterium]
MTDALRFVARHVPLYLIVALVIGIHLPTMHYYFFGDDFLVLGDIQTRAFPSYMRDVVLLRDLTPNWRPLTMAVYYAEFRLFGMDAMAWRVVNLSVHVATVVLLYSLVLSMSRRVFVAAAAALVFGVSASAVHTVTYITAFPHVFSEFLLVASLGSLHLYVQSGERRRGWYWLSFLLYVAGFLANEGGVVIGAVLLTYYATASFMRRRDPLDFALKMLPFGLAAALLVSGLSGCGCQGVDQGFYGVGWHIPQETWIYMSRLAFPVGKIALEPSATEWVWGSIVAGFAIFFLVRGPNLARFAAVGMVIALMPYVPGKIWTASRYTYMALPFFAILVAVAAGWVHQYAVRLNRVGAHALAAVALVAVGGLYAWQTTAQTQPFLHDTDRWQLLATELPQAIADAPDGSTVYVIDDEGLWSNPYWQPTWMTSVGHALYGKDVSVRALPSADAARLRDSLGEPMYLVEYADGHLRRVSSVTVRNQPGQ